LRSSQLIGAAFKDSDCSISGGSHRILADASRSQGHQVHNPSKARRRASGEEQTQTIFVACTAVRAVQVASRIEVQTAIPVVTGNLAAAWACLRHCGLPPDSQPPDAGRRFDKLQTIEQGAGDMIPLPF
jgi:Arylmalonate decarboxylase